MAHTPGPWTAVTDPIWYPWPEAVGIASTRGKYSIAWMTSNAKDRATDEANARLIAAAPEMLAILQEMIGQPTPQSVIDRARQIIAKATGQQG